MFVVGLGHPEERLFLRADNRAAIDYSKQTKRRIVQLHSTQVCSDAIADLFGEKPL